MARYIASSQSLSVRPPSSRTVTDILLAGVAGLGVWEVLARLVAPLWLGQPLEPAELIEMYLGVGGTPAQVLHVLIGLAVFPAVYLAAVLPLAARLVPRAGWIACGVAFGLMLWLFAMVMVAALSGGLPQFWGFGTIAWTVLMLIGHLGLGLAIAGVVHLRGAAP
ncbi:hypothetical protein [Elioraea sp.]|uniref:hypothetical protein n=1 Tax=Elioraea sp. TaxID=2185103 RepID=UPI003F6F4D16